MRNPTIQEIDQLTTQGCSCSDWSQIFFAEPFRLEAIRDVTFSGRCHIGTLDPTKNSRLSACSLDNCDIGNDVYIRHVGLIRNYSIGDEVRLGNVHELIYCPEPQEMAKFTAAVLDETGRRSVPFNMHTTAQIAFLTAYAVHNSAITFRLKQLIGEETAQLYAHPMGEIASGSEILYCGTLHNILILSPSIVRDIVRMDYCILSASRIMAGSLLEHVVAMPDSTIAHSILKHCFVGENTIVEDGFTAHDTLIFSNCHLSQGEAAASILGPHTVSMHKSSLLIGGCFYCFNAGSGTNQSNHHYRLGPIHFGIAERGCSTSSDSYILWPAHIGIYSKIAGRILTRPNLANLPYSTVAAKGSETYVKPGSELLSLGLYRNLIKWKNRDKRLIPDNSKESLFDIIDYSFFSSYATYRLMMGYKMLQHLSAKYPRAERYVVEGAYIEKDDLDNGIKHYRAALLYSLVNMLERRLCAEDDHGDPRPLFHRLLTDDRDTKILSRTPAIRRYYDLLGCTLSYHALEAIYEALEHHQIATASDLHRQLRLFASCDCTNSPDGEGSSDVYHQLLDLLAILAPVATQTYGEALEHLLPEAYTAVSTIYKAVFRDIQREAKPKRSVGMGLLALSDEQIQKELAYTREHWLTEGIAVHLAAIRDRALSSIKEMLDELL